MKIGSKQYEFLKRDLNYNPKMTSGEAARKAKLYGQFLDTKQGDKK